MMLVCSVMAWGVDVAETGGVKYSSLQAAINAADPGATVTLLTNTSGNLTLSKDVRLDGNKTLSGTITVSNDITVTLAGFNVSHSSDVFSFNNHNLDVIIEEGTMNVLKTTGYNDVFCGFHAGTETIHVSGNGTLYAVGYEVFLVYYVYVDAPNIIVAAHNGYMIYGKGLKGGELRGGIYRYDPSPYGIADGYLLSKVDLTEDVTLSSATINKEEGTHPTGVYTKIIPQGNVKVLNKTQLNAYESGLSQAVAEAVQGDYLIMYADDATDVAVGKNIEIAKNGHSVNVSATDGRTKYETSERVLISNNALVAYLQGNSSATYTISTEDLTSAGGQIIVNGEKSLSIPEGKTLNCVSSDAGYSILIPSGAKLSLSGKGTIATNKSLIQIAKGGELVVGSSENSDALTFTTSYNAAANNIVLNRGKATLYNAVMHAKSAAINNYGAMEIIGGLYTGEASTTTATGYCITSDVESQLHMKGVTVKGVHGAVACQGLDPLKKSAVALIEDCDLQATNTPNGTPVSGGVHYGLYTATTAIVSAYRTKFSTTDKPYAVVVGNNDAMSTFGLVYLYDGCMVKANNLTHKLYVQKRKTSDSQVLFPVSIDENNSAWYQAAVKGGEGPLPAGCEYYAILDNDGSRTGSDTIDTSDPENKKIYSHALHEAGYTWKVFSKASEAQEATGTTIPWQQNTTWTDTEVGDVVPAATTAVTIPEGKTVVVSKDETNKNAVAEQLHIGSGASLTVQEGTTLAIGEGGINIADGGQLIVEDKAIVTVGEAGIVTANENAIVIKSDADGTGAFLIHPDVTENTRPAATVEMYAKAHKVGENWFPQHCGIPTVGAPESIIFPAGGVTYMDKFVADGATPWEAVTSISALEPFVGYRLNFSGANEAGVYTFKGNLQGNGDAPLQFVKPYYNLLANSYTSPMDIEALFNGLTTQYGDGVDLTLWVYNSTNNRHEVVSKADITNQETDFTTIAPMQGYILYCGPTQAQAGSIDYESTIWECAKKIGVPILAPARNVNDGRIRATIVVTSATSSDKVVLREADNYSNAFENGADARKYMSENVFNIYSTNNGEAFSQIATDNLMGTAITVKAANETAYTLSFSNVQNFNYAIRDNLSGAIIPVEEGMTYEFTMNEGATAEGRFEVVERYNTPTGVENIEAARSAKGIYTVLGQYIGESSLLNTLPTGIYVVDGQRIVK